MKSHSMLVSRLRGGIGVKSGLELRCRVHRLRVRLGLVRGVNPKATVSQPVRVCACVGAVVIFTCIHT